MAESDPLRTKIESRIHATYLTNQHERVSQVSYTDNMLMRLMKNGEDLFRVQFVELWVGTDGDAQRLEVAVVEDDKKIWVNGCQTVGG